MVVLFREILKLPFAVLDQRIFEETRYGKFFQQRSDMTNSLAEGGVNLTAK